MIAFGFCGRTVFRKGDRVDPVGALSAQTPFGQKTSRGVFYFYATWDSPVPLRNESPTSVIRHNKWLHEKIF